MVRVELYRTGATINGHKTPVSQDGGGGGALRFNAGPIRRAVKLYLTAEVSLISPHIHLLKVRRK